MIKGTLLGLSLALTAPVSFADEIYVDVGTDLTSILDDGDTVTDAYTAMGVNVSATSTITNGFEIAPGEFVPVPGVSTFTESGAGNITNFLPVGGDTEGLNLGLMGLGYALDFSYAGLTGYIDGSGAPVFNAYDGVNTNYIDIFFRRLSDNASEQVLRLLVSGSSIHPLGAGVAINGEIDYSFLAVDNTGADSATFFNMDESYKGSNSFYDIWAASTSIIDNVRFRFDFNVDPQDADVAYMGNAASASRTTTLDGSVTFNVAEPSMVAALGFALMLTGFAGRRRRLKK